MAEKILIVDDDIDSLKLIGLMLQRHGYEVIAANSGTQAINKAMGERPNLIILDVMMPDMDGYEVTNRLRSERATENIPIIMFTAKTLIDDKVKAFQEGADDYLTKPTHPAELASRVKAILARNASRGANGAQSKIAVGVFGVKGGVGTTTIAINLAAVLAKAGASPILADFNLGSGSMGLYLGHGQVSSMATLLSKPVGDISERTIENQITTHQQSGLKLLFSSTRPKESLLEYSPSVAVNLVNTIKEMASPAIFDLGHHMTVAMNRIIRELDRLIIVVEPSKVSLTMARELMQMLEADGVGRAKINPVVVNRVQSSMLTPWQEIEQALGHDIKAIIAADPDLALQAIDMQTPLVLFRPNAIPSTQMIKFADEYRALIGAR